MVGRRDALVAAAEIISQVQALALESDMTRVFSFKLGRDASSRVYPESGVPKGFHPASHHAGRENNIEEFALINRYHVSLLPYFLDKLQSIEDGDRTLLDKTMILYGSPMGDPNVHNHKRCPLIVLGGANGQLDGKLHVRAEPGTPMANVMLTLMQRLGFEEMQRFGDSTGAFSLSA